MQRASELTLEQIDAIVRGMDWADIEEARIFNDYGDQVVLYTDGTFSIQDQSTYYPDPDAAGVISYLNCWGQGNIDREVYYEGWATPVEDGYLVNDDYYDSSLAGKVISEREMLHEAVQEGLIDNDAYTEAVMENVEQERDYREALRDELER